MAHRPRRKAYLPLTKPWETTPEVVIERRLRTASLDYIREHPGYLATVVYWNTRRLLDLSSWRWSRHTAATISVEPRWADAGVVCFWIVGRARACRRGPKIGRCRGRSGWCRS